MFIKFYLFLIFCVLNYMQFYLKGTITIKIEGIKKLYYITTTIEQLQIGQREVEVHTYIKWAFAKISNEPESYSNPIPISIPITSHPSKMKQCTCAPFNAFTYVAAYMVNYYYIIIQWKIILFSSKCMNGLNFLPLLRFYLLFVPIITLFGFYFD